MAKKKASSTADNKPAATTRKIAANVKPQTTSSNGREAPITTRASVAAAPALTTELIGDAAGKVWGLLAEHGSQSLAAIKKSVDLPGDAVLAAVGWLARENKLEFTTKGRTLLVALR